MSLHRRLRRLEQRSSAPGVCPVCGFGPDDVRTVLAVCPPDSQRLPAPAEPPRQRCARCGGWMGPIRIVEWVAEASPGGTVSAEDEEEAVTDRRGRGGPG